MTGKRTRYSAEFKARVALEALRGELTTAQLAAKHGTRSDRGRDCRDAFLGLAKTCTRLGLAFWDYLGARLGCTEPGSVPDLSQLVSAPLPRA